MPTQWGPGSSCVQKSKIEFPGEMQGAAAGSTSGRASDPERWLKGFAPANYRVPLLGETGWRQGTAVMCRCSDSSTFTCSFSCWTPQSGMHTHVAGKHLHDAAGLGILAEQ